MIPIRDTIPSRTYPVITVGLIAVNSAAFLYQLSLGSRLSGFLATFGLVPARFFHFIGTEPVSVFNFLPFLTSMFLHGGWFHIIGNMWYLWIFGDNVEDRIGHVKFFIFYVLCGIAAGLTHLFTNHSSGVPTIGASGAIAGVMGAYFVLYPRAKVWTLIPVFFFVQFVELPAFVLLGFWILIQFLSGTFAIASGLSQGVAWWAHTGGFAAGAILVFIFRKRKRHLPRRYSDEYQPW